MRRRIGGRAVSPGAVGGWPWLTLTRRTGRHRPPGCLAIAVLAALMGGDRHLDAATQGASAASAASGGLPVAPGSELAARRCLACHDADLIIQQRLDEPAWAREVAKMQRWGATVSDIERPRLVGYLSRYFGPQQPAQAQPEGRREGERTYETTCRICHDDDLPAQQRLDLTAWLREIDKMVRWGAPVADEQKAALADYLFSQWGRP